MPQSGIKGLRDEPKLLTIEQSSGNHFFSPGLMPQHQLDKRRFQHSGKRSRAMPERFPMAKMRDLCPCGSGSTYRTCCASRG